VRWFIDVGLATVAAPVLLSFSACASIESKLDSYIGSRIDRQLDPSSQWSVDFVQAVPANEPGYMSYEFKQGEACRIFWIVDEGGVIVGSRYEGSACRSFRN
jgi:hypothetical protein